MKKLINLNLLFLLVISLSSCGTYKMVKSIDLAPQKYRVIYEDSKFVVESRVKKEFRGGFTGFVFGEAFGPGELVYRQYLKIRPKQGYENARIKSLYTRNSCKLNINSNVRISYDYNWGSTIRGTWVRCKRTPTEVSIYLYN